MKLINIKSCVLHNPIFVGAKNFKERVAVKDFTGLKLEYDNVKDALYFTWNGETMKLTNNVAGVIPVDPADMGIEPTPVTKPTATTTHTSTPMVANVSRTAQIETPMSKPPTPPGLRNKFQGA